MNLIFAKHDRCAKEFLFEVPDGMHPVAHDILWVDTMKGETIAIATSDTISCDNIEQIAQRFGAYFPLKKVKTYANKGLQCYIENSIYREVWSFCEDRQECNRTYANLPS